MLKAKLVVIGGDARTAEIPLKLPTIIGRGREVNLTLPHPLVSRQHCELLERKGKLLVRDLQSLNGTYVDNRRIDQSAILKPDQLLTIGNVTFRAVYMENSADHDTEVQAQAETELSDAPQSVIEIENVASADDDSKEDPIGHDESIHSRPTTPGKRTSQRAATEATESEKRASSDDDDCVITPDQLNETVYAPQHSVCAAMLDAGVAPPPDDARLSEIQRQLPESDSAAASNIDELTVHDDDRDASKVGDSFAGIDAEEEEQAAVNPEESALGSFIRKLPR